MPSSQAYAERSQAAEAAIRSAFEFRNEAAPYMINDVNYFLFGELSENIPLDYCDENPTSQIEFQLRKIQRHMAEYDDAYIPFLMPWYGTGVLASAFGVETRFPDRTEPAVGLPLLDDLTQVKDLRAPDPHKDGLATRVLSTIRAMRRRACS